MKRSYFITRSPIGAEISVLPEGFMTAYLNSNPYYYYYGTFFRYDRLRKVYIIIKAPMGINISELPETYETGYLNNES